MKKITKYMLMSLIVLGGIFLITQGFTYAKYVSSSVWNYYLKSKGFYFSSPDLTLEGTKNINNNWDFESTYFKIQNSINDSLVSDYDIKYKATCVIDGEEAEYSECRLNGSESNIFEGTLSNYSYCSNPKDDKDVSLYTKEKCEVNGYAWVNQVASQDLYFDIIETTDKEVTNLKVLIEVETTSPYKKILKGEYIINKGRNELGSLNMKYDSYDTYERVTISNSYKENKCAKLKWNSDNLRIDSNNMISNNTDSNGYINEIIFSISSKSNNSYIFYKTDKTKNYSIDDFTLIESAC